MGLSSSKLPIMLVLGIGFVILIFTKPVFGICFLLLSIPMSPSIVVGHTALRDITIRFDDFICIIMGILWAIRIGTRKGIGIRRTGVEGAILALAGVYVLSTLINMPNLDKKSAFFFLAKYLQYYFIFFLPQVFIESEDDVRLVEYSFILSGFILSISFIPQLLAGRVGGDVRFPFEVVHGGRENVGIYMLVLISIFTACMFEERNNFLRFLWATGAILAFPTYLRTLSRASYLGGVAWFFSMLFFSGNRIPLLAMLAVFIIFGGRIAPEYVIQRLKYTFEGDPRRAITLWGLPFDLATTARFRTWGWLFSKRIPRSPIIGFGVTGIGLVDSQYIRVVGEVGFLGFGIFAILMRRIFKVFRGVYESYGGMHRAFGLGMLCSLIGMMFHMVAANTFVLLQISEMFWLMAGVMCSLYVMIPKRDSMSS